MSRFAEWVRRFVDLTCSLAALVVFFPVWLAIAVAIKINDGGPIFYTEKRLGKNMVPFTIYKFRTMTVGAPAIRSADGSWDNQVDDPRVTQVGRFLRATSLDEIPQFVNVLLGEMALVGPRPDPVLALDTYEKTDLARLSVKPGITGWAAIHGRKAIDLRERRRLDLEYLDKRSLEFDLRILLMTFPKVLGRQGVYSDDLGSADPRS